MLTLTQFVATYPLFTLLLVASVIVCIAGAALFVRDAFLQRHQAIIHNFPVVGHLRYLMEQIGPELRQYWVANDKEEQPFNRSERSWVYASAKGQNNTFGFGTSELIYGTGYPIIKHVAFPFPEGQATYIGGDKTALPCLKIMGETHGRRRPFRPRSVINVSAMSFGSLGQNAIASINQGVLAAGAYHNTGEGGVSPHHEYGADLVWQLGTGYFGARGPDGAFSLDVLAQKVSSNTNIRAIEIKLSQGAKPGKGGILPGAKVTAEIAKIRGIPIGTDCLSPNAHTEFCDVDGLIDFVERIADRTGLPVGIKSAVGHVEFWRSLAARMKERNQGPDYIQIDGGEGGTGAAPLTFSDHVSLPWKIAFARVFQIFQDQGMEEDLVWIGSGKLGFPDRAVVAFAMGADLICVAREAMMAIGCIQAQKCHTGHCPAGVATHDRWLQKGLDVEIKSVRMTRYLQTFRKELISLSHAAGYQHPGQFTSEDVEFCTGVNRFSTLAEVIGYRSSPLPFSTMADYASDAKPATVA